MISPDMFQEFVVPALAEQCAWLDHSLFHLDGPNCICHLQHLLDIDGLDAVQWTPGAGEPGAGDETWYPLYERILSAGKSAQILGATVPEAHRILDTFGRKGIFLGVEVNDESQAEDIIQRVEEERCS
jgi:hypothetical protein